MADPSSTSEEPEEQRQHQQEEEQHQHQHQHHQHQQHLQDGDAPKPSVFRLRHSLKAKKPPPGGFDATPLPDAPPGFTLRFVFRSAANLAPADVSTGSSDPYLTATLRPAGPSLKRHREDPELEHRTPTLRRTTAPAWLDEWVVANVPPAGFTLKCRLYDEDARDADDRLGNVTVRVDGLSAGWEGFPPPGREFAAKRRVVSKRALVLKGLASVLGSGAGVTPRLTISIELLGPSGPPHAHMCTLEPTAWVKHFSPMIGRIVGTRVNADEADDRGGGEGEDPEIRANEMQLQGPVPPRLYHYYVEFRPLVASMFSSTGLRGRILNAALHKQHRRIYNHDRTIEYGRFEACSEAAALQFLRLAHFADGGRVFTYVLTLDGLLRFTETGREFGIDLLSKHTMHSDVATYIACSGEFLVRRLPHPHAPDAPACYQLVIDNDSGTYRPDPSVLPELRAFLARNLPGLAIVAMHWEDDELQRLEAQRTTKRREGRVIHAVLDRSRSVSSAESELDRRDGAWDRGGPSRREAAYAAVEDPARIKDAVRTVAAGG